MESGELDEDEQLAKENVKEEKEKKRKRTSSGHSISDSNSTPTSEQKPKLTLDLQSPEAKGDSSSTKSPKQRNTLQSTNVVSPINKLNNVFDSEAQSAAQNEVVALSPKEEILSPKPRIMSPRDEVMSPTGMHHGNLLRSPNTTRESSLNWFHLFPKKACDETSLTRASIILPAVNKGGMIVPPNARLLSQDRSFCESISDRHLYMHGHIPGAHGHQLHHNPAGYYENPIHHGDKGIHGAFTPNGATSQIFHYPSMHQNVKMSDYQSEEISKAAALGLAPPGVDIQKLIKQDPQEAAVLLEIQSLEPAPVPEGEKLCIPPLIKSFFS